MVPRGAMKELTIRYPDELPGLLRKTDREFVDEARYLLAAKLYELGRISSGKAAEMAGTARLEFLRRLADYGIAALSLDEEEAQAEVQAARDLAR
jgi:predicted HTH domain antitoxin